MKKIVVILLSTIVLSCTKESKKASTLVDFIPKDAHLVIKINDFEQTKSLLRDNHFLKKNNELALLAYFKNISILKESKTSNSLLCFSKIGKNDFEYTYISKFDPSSIQNDSLNTKSIETITYTDKIIYKIDTSDQTFYATQQDSILIASSSQILIENAIRTEENKLPVSNDLLKAYEVTNTKKPVSLLINGKKLQDIHNSVLPNNNLNEIQNFSGWISVDASIKQNTIALDGIAIEKDSLSTTIGIFDNTIPQENHIAKITPITANGFTSYTYDDFEILKKNLAFAQEREIVPSNNTIDELFSGISEIGIVYLEQESILAFTSIDIENTKELLNGVSAGSYRNTPIYKYNEPTIFSSLFTPLLPEFNAQFYFLHNNQIVFGSSKNVLQGVIANIQNNTLLANQSYYSNISKKLSNNSSILLVSSIKNLKEYITKNVEEDYQKEWGNLKDSGYPIGIIQVVKEGNFAHLHCIIEKNNTKNSNTSINQIAATTLENKVLNDPILVKNHRTKGMDITVQDIDNNLYLISDKGNIFWKKKLDGAIIGDIQQIDMYKNGRYQLLFNTKNTLYVVDRNGKDVAPYPKKFSTPITQPISLFDYDKNKRYRIVVTQGNAIQMLDVKGKIVTGFTFKNTKSKLVSSPKHIRIGSKDYILLAEENGKLNILDRVGRTRINVKDSINFSSNPWYQYQNTFTSINNTGMLTQVQSNGSVITKQEEGFDKNTTMIATNKTLVTLSGNKLSIKNTTIELEYGVYTDPQLFYINNKIYISTTDIQSKKVYLFDSNADLLPNFPVYGNSAISLGNMDKDPNLEFAVKGEENGILIYQIN